MILVGQNVGKDIGVEIGDVACAIRIDAVDETVLGGGHIETFDDAQGGQDAHRRQNVSQASYLHTPLRHELLAERDIAVGSIAAVVGRIVPQAVVFAGAEFVLKSGFAVFQPIGAFGGEVIVIHQRGQGLATGEGGEPGTGDISRCAVPVPDIVKLVRRRQFTETRVRLLVDQSILIVIKRELIPNRALGRVIEVRQLVPVAGAQVEAIDPLGILARVQRMLAMLTRVAHGAIHAIRKVVLPHETQDPHISPGTAISEAETALPTPKAHLRADDRRL